MKDYDEQSLELARLKTEIRAHNSGEKMRHLKKEIKKLTDVSKALIRHVDVFFF